MYDECAKTYILVLLLPYRLSNIFSLNKTKTTTSLTLK